MTTPTAFVRAGRLRALVRRHPWIYPNSIQRIEGSYENGDAVVVRAPDGKFVAHGLINDSSLLRIRLVSFERKVEIDEALLRARVRDAVKLRTEALGLPARTNAYRLIHSEGDGLPGLIVDRYGDVLVFSCTCLGIQQRLDPILDELQELLSPVAILSQPPAPEMCEREGLSPIDGAARGVLPEEEPVVEIDGLRLAAPVIGGQKTGLFLDQRDNVRRVAELSPGRRVLDVCCYVGVFGLAAAKAGAASVLQIDSSKEALGQAEANAARNELEDRVERRRGSLFQEMSKLAKEERAFDLIVLDPPKFASRKRDLPKARKGYIDANLMALRLLAPGGMMLTCSCSGHVDLRFLEEVLREAVTRSGVDLRVLERLGAGPDHPVDAHCPEGRYLKALLVQRRGG